jgi:EpsD family peptidyl-prolyl cis-trans isomerase
MRYRSLGLLAASVLLLAACGQRDDKKTATQTAARVNGAEITVHQINQLLSRVPGVTEEAAPKLRQEVLTKLIDQQLAVEQALNKKLERQPEVMAALEASKRDILARAYLDQVIAAQGKPTAEEVKKYYTDTPQLFAQRRIYTLQEISIEKNEQLLPALREKVAAAKSMEEIAGWLKDKGARFNVQSGTRPAEQIPLDMLVVLHSAREGQNVVIPGAKGIAVMHILTAPLAPVDEATALPRIQQFLGNQRGMQAVEAEMKQLRTKAKIEYLGSFAEGAAATPAPVEKSTVPAPPAAPAAGNVEKAVGALK